MMAIGSNVAPLIMRNQNINMCNFRNRVMREFRIASPYRGGVLWSLDNVQRFLKIINTIIRSGLYDIIIYLHSIVLHRCIALNHQRHINKWWETEYSDNIHSYLQYHEVKWRMVYGARSPQIHLRPVLLKTIRSIAKTCEISNVCVHLAVTLMDLFMDNHDLKFDTIMLVSFACLTLAAKIEEHCLNIPKLKTMQNVISKDVTNSHFRKVEMKILMFFEFNVAIPTVAHFIEFYKDHFYCDNDFYHNEFASILKDKFNNMIISYQDASLESIKLISYNPSMVAASIILTTRHALGLVPCWTAQLRKVTGYLKKDLVQCCSLLGRNVMQHRKLVPVDEGYLSSSPGFQSPIIMASKKKRSHIDVPNVILSKRTAF